MSQETAKPSKPHSFLQHGPILLALVVLMAWTLASLIPDANRFALFTNGPDDRFYYLQIAWNHSKLGFATFDGISSTNGVHPCWYIINLAAAVVSKDKEQLQLIAFLISVGFLGLSLWLVWNHKLFQNEYRVRVLALGLALVYSLAGGLTLSGMENSITGIFLLWLIHLVLQEEEEKGSFFKIQLFCSIALIVFCRIEHLIYVVAVLVWLYSRSHSRTLLALGAGSILLSIAFTMGFMYWMAGSFFSVSGSAKFAGFPTSFEHLSTRLEQTLLVLTTGSIVQLPTLFLIFIGLVVSVFYRHRSDFGLHLAVSIGFIIHLLIAVLLLSAVSFWYFTVAQFTLLFFVVKLADQFPSRKLPKFSAACCYLLAGLLTGKKLLVPDVVNSTSLVRYQAGKHLEKETEKNAVIASWNAGQLGWFSNRRLINLDGLVNTRIYLDLVLGGRMPLSEYCDIFGIKYIVDYRDYSRDKWLSKSPVVKSWERKGKPDEPLRMWDVEATQSQSPGGWLGRWR